MAEPKRKTPARRAVVRSPRATTKSSAQPGSDQLRLSERTPALEWIAAGVGLMVTLAALAFLTWQSLQPHPDIAEVRAVVRAISPSPAGFQVEVEAANDTRVTAAQVQVEGVLALPDGGEEVSAITFDYVPGGGRRAGMIIFRHDPRGGGLTVTTRGHVRP